MVLLLFSQLRGTVWAAGCFDGDGGQAEGAILAGCFNWFFRCSTFLKSVDCPNEKEYNESNNEKINDVINEETIVQSWGGSFLGSLEGCIFCTVQ